jgi:hypothetical protein
MIHFVTFLLLTQPVFAMEELNERQVAHLTQQVNEYFGPKPLGKLAQLETVRPNHAAIKTILRAVRMRLARDEGGWEKAAPIFKILAEKSIGLGAPADSDLRSEFHADLDWLLRGFHHRGVEHGFLLEIYDRWLLWGPADLWYFLTLRGTDQLNIHGSRLRILLPTLSELEMKKLAETLRRLQPLTLFQMAMLYESGQIQDKELVRLLNLASMQFARALDRRDHFQDDDSLQIYLMSDPAQRSVAMVLSDIMRRLQEGDLMVGSAYDKALQNAGRSRPNVYNRLDRVEFFSRLRAGRLQWADRTSWGGKTSKISDRYKVEDGVIHVQFGRGRSNCEDDLM